MSASLGFSYSKSNANNMSVNKPYSNTQINVGSNNNSGGVSPQMGIAMGRNGSGRYGNNGDYFSSNRPGSNQEDIDDILHARFLMKKSK